MTSATAAATNAIQHTHQQQNEYMKGFHDLLKIPSISTDPAYKAEVERCANWIVDEMKRIGLRNASAIPTSGHPVVYGEWLEAGADKPTILLYAHYDVQPVDPLALWDTPPFEPSVREGRLYARGVCDDKAAVWGILKSVESMMAANGTLPVNIKVFFEGEEESGSPSMEPFIVANKDMLKADLFLICDGGFDPDNPEQIYAVRGIVGIEVTVTGPDHDLHSGMFGGVVQNPLHVVGKIIGSFHDEAGRVQIAGYYDRVKALSASEKANLDALFDPQIEDLKKKAGVSHFWAESLGTLAERGTALPTLDVNGMWGGYQGEGTKTVLPAQASFKATLRLVPDQDPYEIGRLLNQHVQQFASDTISIQTRVSGEGWPCAFLFEGPVVDALNQSYFTTIGKTPKWMRIGGSIPISGMFQRELDAPMSGFGFGAGDNYHSPNEYLIFDHFRDSMDTFIHFMYKLAEPGVVS